jgi:predicted nucleic acid-binding protein
MSEGFTQIPDELLDSKLYSKLADSIGEEEARSFFRRSEADLRATIAECEVQQTEAVQQRDENEAYIAAKATVDVLNKGLRDACKEIKLKKQIASKIIAYMNEVKRAK